MSDLIISSPVQPATDLDDGVFAPWNENRANHGFIKSRLPAWYSGASTELRAALRKSQLFSLFSRRDVEPLRKKLKSVKAFAEPLLEQQLVDTFSFRLDLHKNDLVTMHTQTFLGVDQRRPFRQSLLQAALQNFEAFEAQEGGFERGAALLPDDGLQLQLVAGTGVNGRYPRFRFRYSGVIGIKPAQFGEMCRRLDLGARYQTHLDSVFKPPALPEQSADERALEVAGKFQRSEQDSVQVLAHIALMKKHISLAAYDMLLALTTPGSTPMWGVEPVRHGWLRMLDSIGEHGNMLLGAMFIEPDKDDDEALPCLVYMPGEPEHPLKEYVSFKAFTDTLRRKLSASAYQDYFRRFISLCEHQRFFVRLNERLMPLRPLDGNPLSTGLRRRLFDERAELSLEKFVYSPAPFQMLYEHLLLKTYEDSRVLAVPTGEEDQKNRMERLQAYESAGVDLLNIASFFIPILGAAMAVIAVEHVLSDIFIGIQEWEDGEIDEAFSHLFGAAENIALAGAVGAIAGTQASSAASAPSAFIENMVSVTLKNGQTRLWKADLAPFQQELTLPNWVMANAEARIEVEGKSYLPLAGKYYQVDFDVKLKRWRLKHPTRADRYSPVLNHNGAGAWRHEGENPMGWDLHTLFRRLHPGLDGTSEQTIERIMAVTHADETLLRRVHVDNIKPPALLSDSISRFQIEHQIDAFITAMNSGNLHEFNLPNINPYLELLTFLPGWPKARVLRLLDSQGVELQVFGTPGSALPAIDLTYLPGQMDDVITSTLASLTPDEVETLLGDYNPRRQSQSSRLAEQLAEVATLRSGSLHDGIYQANTPAEGPSVKLIRRDFPALPTGVANELLESASAQEISRMTLSSRLPLRMAEQAREYQQQLRLNRVNEGFYFKGGDSPDLATAGVSLLSRLPGWPENLALEIREGTFSGELLASVGDYQTSARRWVLVKSGQRYQTLDSVGNSIDSGGHPFFSAVLQALPSDARAAIGLSSDATESALRAALGDIAVGQRDAVALALGMQKINPGFKWPQRLADGRLGYPLSGRFRRLFSRFGLGARNHSAELAVKSLFPGMEEAEVRLFISALRAGYTGPSNDLSNYIQGQIRAMEIQYEQLDATLDSWVSAPSEPRVRGNRVWFVTQEDRRLAATRIKRCWKRLSRKCYSERGQFLGYSLDLNQLAIGELPVLTARFDHVRGLYINHIGLDADAINTLLGQFSDLRELYLRDNDLTSIPEALSAHTALEQLSLRGNPLVLDQRSVNRLQGLLQLRTLNLNHCPIGPLLDVSGMRRLVRLSLRATGIDALPAGIGDCVNLIILDARNNRIGDIPETTFHDARAIYRRLQLHDNPLSEGTRDRARGALSHDAMRIMGITDDRPHAQDELSPLALWLTESSDEERPIRLTVWNDLQAEPDSSDFFRVLNDLTASADYQGSRQVLTQRVWTVLESAVAHGALRDELFTLAAHPQTCGDGIMLVFNDLEIRVLVFNVMASARVGAQETELFQLARGLERLDEVEKIAREDIATRSLGYPPLDPAEVRLAYRIGLAQRLKLPLQPKGMIFSRLAGVTEQAIDAAEEQVLQREKAPAFLNAMIARDFWMEYLQTHYAARFEPVQTPFHERLSDLDDRAYATLRNDEYLEQIELIREERAVATNLLALQLTREIKARQPLGRISPPL